jgi:hypothetical protein
MAKGAAASNRKNKDQEMAARLGKIDPLGSAKKGMTAALSERMRKAIDAGKTPPGGWFELPTPKPKKSS